MHPSVNYFTQQPSATGTSSQKIFQFLRFSLIIVKKGDGAIYWEKCLMRGILFVRGYQIALTP